MHVEVFGFLLQHIAGSFHDRAMVLCFFSEVNNLSSKLNVCAIMPGDGFQFVNHLVVAFQQFQQVDLAITQLVVGVWKSSHCFV